MRAKACILTLSLIGIFTSGYLLWLYSTPARPLFCFGTGCDLVRLSQYSHPRGVPLPVLGVLMYTILAVLALVSPVLTYRLLWLADWTTFTVSLLGFLFSAYLTSVEAFVVNAWCSWCVASMVTITMVFVMAAVGVTSQPVSTGHTPSRPLQINSVIVVAWILAGAPAFVGLVRGSRWLPVGCVLDADRLHYLVRPDSHSLGNPRSPVTIVEFADFQCPACAKAQPTVRHILRKYGGRIRLVVRQFPVASLHPQAEEAAEATECAADQGKFWSAVDTLYKNQRDLSVPALENYALYLGLNSARFDECLATHATLSRVRRDMSDGQRLGVRGTPMFVIGRQLIEQSPGFGEMSAFIDHALTTRDRSN